MSDEIRERMLKVLRLANQGIGGERANAEALLAKLLTRHNLTREELESSTEDRTVEWFPVASDLEAQFIMAVAETACDRSLMFYQNGEKRTKIGAELSRAERVSTDLLLDVYAPKWRSTLFESTVAFCIKNDLTGV